MTKLRCITLDTAWEKKYTDFVSSHKGAMLYHDLKYRDLLVKMLGVEPGYLIAVDENEEVKAVLPLMYKKGALGVVVNSLPFYGSNGAALAADAASFDFLTEYYNKTIASDKNIASTTIISNPLLPDGNYEEIKYNIKDHRIGQFTPIAFMDNTEENLMNTFHYKTRNMVRKSQKQGLEVIVDNTCIDFLYSTHKQNMEAIGGKAKEEKFFHLFPEVYEAGKDYKIYVALENGVPIAGLLLFYFNGTVEYYTPVIVEEHREKQPLSLLIFEAMKQASEDGFRLWNWGGTWASQDGVYRFKKRWGTQDINYYYYTQVNNEKIYSASKEVLLNEYPFVFVLPFQHLEKIQHEKE